MRRLNYLLQHHTCNIYSHAIYILIILFDDVDMDQDSRNWQKLPCFVTLHFQETQLNLLQEGLGKVVFLDSRMPKTQSLPLSILKQITIINKTAQITSGCGSCLANCSLFYKNTSNDGFCPNYSDLKKKSIHSGNKVSRACP